MKTAFLFPGQGSQQPGMLNQLPVNDPDVAMIFSEAENLLHQEISEIDNSVSLSSTINVQLSLLIAGVISARRLSARGVVADFVAGHSVGAFAAAVFSQVISFEQAINLVHNRARLMELAFPAGYGMAALVGFSLNRLKPFLDDHNNMYSTVYISNINAADQLVVSGEISSIKLLIESLQRAGIQKAKILDVKVPSHCPLLNSVSDSLNQQIGAMEMKNPIIPFASNTSGRLLKTGEAVGQDLAQSLSATVKWDDATTLLYEKGTRIFIEMAPSGVLAKIAASTFSEAGILMVDESRINQLFLQWNNYKQEKYI